MPTPKQFRELALECMHQAEETPDEKERQVLLGMAARWMRAAVHVERSSTDPLEDNVPRVDDDGPLVPKNDKT
jgi:hypothetical protein